MTPIPSKSAASSRTVMLLYCGVLVPVLYFGAQLVAAPFYPGYSFLANAASDFGSSSFVGAGVFNVVIFGVGVASLLAAVGLVRSARLTGMHSIWVWLTALCVAAFGLSSLWAGAYPLPDSRHGQNPFTPGVLLLPFLFAVSFWRLSGSRWWRAFLLGCVVVLVALVPVVSGLAGLNTSGVSGLLQRLLTLAMLPTLGASAVLLVRKWREASG
jgi:hypothetical protein